MIKAPTGAFAFSAINQRLQSVSSLQIQVAVYTPQNRKKPNENATLSYRNHR
jgi:hypothetical protein